MFAFIAEIDRTNKNIPDRQVMWPTTNNAIINFYLIHPTVTHNPTHYIEKEKKWTCMVEKWI